MSTKWTIAEVPDQRGRVAVVTGANSGIGLWTAVALANKGAHVVLAVRNVDKGNAVAAQIAAQNPRANATVQQLDLSSLQSIRRCADELKTAHQSIDLLINNAGVMYPPKGTTEDGFELQFGTNHLGHFALTGLLLERLLPVEGSRVVTLGSNGHKMLAKIHFDDLQWERRYRKVPAYGQSKLANLLFTYELQNRLDQINAPTSALAAHPGSTNTDLTRHLPTALKPVTDVLWPLMSQSAEMGALPTLRAATDPSAKGGQYYGPDGFGEQRGNPILVQSNARSHDQKVQHLLWEVSEELTDVVYPL